MAPLPVSVVIPAYNRPEMTRLAVLSAYGQRPDPPAEVIVVDDCSTDETGAAAAEAGARVIRHPHNQGEGASRNTGIAAAKHDWIGLLDSDDRWEPHLLATLWPHRGRRDVVGGSAWHAGEALPVPRYAGPIRRGLLHLRPELLLYPENLVSASGVLVRKEAVQAAGGYNPDLKFAADLDLWLRMLERGAGVMLPTVVVSYARHFGQATNNREAMAATQLSVVRAYAGRPWYSPARVEAWRGGTGWDQMRRALRAGDRAAAAGAALFIARHPVRIAGVAGILYRRHCMRRHAVQIAAERA
jgi:glycosyltransferase involved in cell wall biosynthesis